jgi:hypothetical protein
MYILQASGLETFITTISNFVAAYAAHSPFNFVRLVQGRHPECHEWVQAGRDSARDKP